MLAKKWPFHTGINKAREPNSINGSAPLVSLLYGLHLRNQVRVFDALNKIFIQNQADELMDKIITAE